MQLRFHLRTFYISVALTSLLKFTTEYANARICGADKWRKPLAKFLRQPHFIVWDNSDLITHEVMGGLKNVYAIGAGNCVFSYLTGLFLFHVLLPLKAYVL
jgi:hypothetical protein